MKTNIAFCRDSKIVEMNRKYFMEKIQLTEILER